MLLLNVFQSLNIHVIVYAYKCVNHWQCILVSEEDEEATFVEPALRGKCVPTL